MQLEKRRKGRSSKINRKGGEKNMEERGKIPSWQEELKIDIYNLEVECEGQPTLFAKWGKRAVKAARKVDDAKVALDRVKRDVKLGKEKLYAELDTDVRKKMSPEKKLTEPAIKSAILTSVNYEKEMRKLDLVADAVEDELLDLREKADILLVVKEAFKQRKDMLSHEVFLWGAEYYSSPDTTTNGIQDSQTRLVNTSKKKRSKDGKRKKKEKE